MQRRHTVPARRRLRAPVFLLATCLLAAPGVARAQIYTDATAETGLDFVQFNGMTGELYFPEMMGGGAALLDYDGDGDLDVFLVQGSLLGAGDTYEDVLNPPADRPPRDRLFRNDSAAGPDGALVPRFVDVTEGSGLGSGYGMGTAAGDYDGDGLPDLYVTRWGANGLYRNLGDGTFEDVTAATGTGETRWSTSAAFLDADGDGDLDLWVANYVDFPLADNPACYSTSSRRDYCGPSDFEPLPDTFYENRGDGTFRDASESAGIAAVPGAGLGVVGGDFDGDSRLDVYVANDGMPNRLWIRGEDGTFTDEALLAGVAVNGEGAAEAGMGVVAGDFDGDGDEDLFLAHLVGETNTLYVNQGDGLFLDRSTASGLAAPSLAYTAFGAAFLDFDLDGRLDLVLANGAERIREEQVQAGVEFPLALPDQLFWNAGGSFREVPAAEAGPGLARPTVSRGVAVGDVDNDGDPDLLFADNNGPARLLLDRVGHEAAWVGLAAAPGTAALSSALPPGRVVRARLDRETGPPLVRRTGTDGGYQSAHDPRVVLGLGKDAAAPAAVALTGAGERRWLAPPTGKYLLVPAE